MIEMFAPAGHRREPRVRAWYLGFAVLAGVIGGASLLVAGTSATAQEPTRAESSGQAAPAGQEAPAKEMPASHQHQHQHQHQHSHADSEHGGEPGDAPQEPIQDDPEVMKKSLAALPEDVRPKAQQAWDRFAETTPKLAAEMLKLRTIQLHYRNGYDQSLGAVKRYREQRIATWKVMQEQFTYALELVRYLPSTEAASYVVTMVQHHFDNGIYDEDTFAAATHMLDLGQGLRFVVLGAARSAVVTGHFDVAKKIYETVDDEGLENADLNLKYQMERIEEQWQQEQQAIKDSDPESLPQVKFSTTQGDFIVELFPEAAPSTVAHFLKLIGNGFYDGMDFSIVTQDILALTGDASGDGRGNAGEFLVDEHAREQRRPALRGSLVMAKLPLGEGQFIENSASSQFAICYLPIPSMADNQTVFGRVIEGMDVVSRLRPVDPTKSNDSGEVLLPPDAIFSTEILRPAKDLPEPVYVDVEAELEKAVKAGLLRRKAP